MKLKIKFTITIKSKLLKDKGKLRQLFSVILVNLMMIFVMMHCEHNI